jgi:hypothetical protein
VTATEDFFNAEVEGRLRPGEKVLHATYLARNNFVFLLANGHFAAITDQRLILIDARARGRRARRENRGVRSIERADIQSASLWMASIVLRLKDGSSVGLGGKYSSCKNVGGQEEFTQFWRDHYVDREAEARRNRVTRIALVATMAVGVLVIVPVTLIYSSDLATSTGVDVDCKPLGGGIGAACEVHRTSGSESLRACWTTQFHCANGRFLKTRSCTDVTSDRRVHVEIPPEKLTDYRRCKPPTEIDVQKVELDDL